MLAAAVPTASLLLPRTTRRGVKYGWSTLRNQDKFQIKYNKAPHLPVLTASVEAAQARKANTTPARTGVLAIKKGMTGYYTRNGKRFPCTVLQLDRVQVVAHKTREKDGYCAVQIGCGKQEAHQVSEPQLGYFEAKGIPPKEHLAEFIVRDEKGLLPPVGAQLLPDWFHKGQWVDVRANSRGQGFAGGMKRHGFAGQEASHGNSKNHRTMGTTGPSQGSGSRVFPGKKMPGRMGNERVTVQNLPVLRVDNDMGIVVVKGCVPGKKGALVKISDAVKKPDPPQEWIDEVNKLLRERFPNAKEDLEAARRTHMDMKAKRQEGIRYFDMRARLERQAAIDEALKNGLSNARA